MKSIKKVTAIFLPVFLLFIFVLSEPVQAQDITFVPQDTNLSDSVGAEIVFYIQLKNVSSVEQTVFVVRTENVLPENWESSLCFDFCFASFVDSIATTVDFFSTPLAPGEEREVSLHVFTLNNGGVANVQLQAGTFSDPNNRIIIDFVASASVTSVEDDLNAPSRYYLEQNFPNPFNPGTKINFGLKESGNVQLKVYDLLGREVATIINDHLESGNYSYTFDASQLTSGIYFYRLSTSDFVQSRKMILEK